MRVRARRTERSTFARIFLWFMWKMHFGKNFSRTTDLPTLAEIMATWKDLRIKADIAVATKYPSIEMQVVTVTPAEMEAALATFKAHKAFVAVKEEAKAKAPSPLGSVAELEAAWAELQAAKIAVIEDAYPETEEDAKPKGKGKVKEVRRGSYREWRDDVEAALAP